MLPSPDKIVHYATSSSEPENGALFLYGDLDSPKMALMCAGFPDDHTVFLPFAKALSEEGKCEGKFKEEGSKEEGSKEEGSNSKEEGSKGGVLVGVMCLPGYDDRPGDDVAPPVKWTDHKTDGYTFDEMAKAVRNAANALRSASTHNNNNTNTMNTTAPLTGIFHDWGVIPGTMWANSLIAEAKASGDNTDNDNAATTWKPDRMVFFDVLVAPPKGMQSLTLSTQKSKSEQRDTNDKQLSKWETVVTVYYKVVLGVSFVIQRYISKHLAAAFLVLNFTLLEVLKLAPLYPFDLDSAKEVYKRSTNNNNNNNNTRADYNFLFRLIYMTYPYRNLIEHVLKGRPMPRLHHDQYWNSTTPILYLYGPKKRTQFHSFDSLALLEENANSTTTNDANDTTTNTTTKKCSISKAVAVEGTGHYLYLQKPAECLKHVVNFMNAEK